MVPLGDQLCAAKEREVRDHCFALLDVRLAESENVNDAEMNAADLGRVVVEQRDDPVFEGGFDPDLFIDLAFDSGAIRLLVPGEKRFIGIVHVPTNPDRAFGHEALLAGLLPAHIMQDRVAMRDQRVRNDLFVGRIVLSLGAGQEEIISARENCLQVLLRLEVQPVEASELVEQAASNNQNIFVRLGHVQKV